MAPGKKAVSSRHRRGHQLVFAARPRWLSLGWEVVDDRTLWRFWYETSFRGGRWTSTPSMVETTRCHCAAFIYLRHSIHRISYQWIDNHRSRHFPSKHNYPGRVGIYHYLFTISNCYIPFHFTISLFPPHIPMSSRRRMSSRWTLVSSSSWSRVRPSLATKLD